MVEQPAHDVHAVERSCRPRVRPPVPDGQPVHVDGGVQRTHAGVFVHDVRIGAGVDEERGEVVVRVDDRDHERGCAIGIGQR